MRILSTQRLSRLVRMLAILGVVSQKGPSGLLCIPNISVYLVQFLVAHRSLATTSIFGGYMVKPSNPIDKGSKLVAVSHPEFMGHTQGPGRERDMPSCFIRADRRICRSSWRFMAWGVARTTGPMADGESTSSLLGSSQFNGWCRRFVALLLARRNSETWANLLAMYKLQWSHPKKNARVWRTIVNLYCWLAFFDV